VFPAAPHSGTGWPPRGDRQSDHDLRQVIAAVLGLAAARKNPAALSPSALVLRWAAFSAAGQFRSTTGSSASPSSSRLGRWYQKTQRSLPGQQVATLVIVPAFQRPAERVQPVHSPGRAGIVDGLGEARRMYTSRGIPPAGGQAGGRARATVGRPARTAPAQRPALSAMPYRPPGWAGRAPGSPCDCPAAATGGVQHVAAARRGSDSVNTQGHGGRFRGGQRLARVQARPAQRSDQAAGAPSLSSWSSGQSCTSTLGHGTRRRRAAFQLVWCARCRYRGPRAVLDLPARGLQYIALDYPPEIPDCKASRP